MMEWKGNREDGVLSMAQENWVSEKSDFSISAIQTCPNKIAETSSTQRLDEELGNSVEEGGGGRCEREKREKRKERVNCVMI